ncbi:PAS domain S-box protein [Methylomonas sp. 2BW1-5-20]|uniref:PAS domain S-box protein n=1 Tax=Methylomonas sp. 2BW1-5-20 TaxID=3376686 RepID=UPI0040527E0A
MQALFSPAVALMNRLSFSKKFVVIGFLSLLAVLVVFYNLYQSLNRVIVESELELRGLEQIKHITQTVQFVQQHRGLSVAVLRGLDGLRDERDRAETKVGASLSALRQTLLGDSATAAALAEINSQWKQLRQNSAIYGAEENYRLHSRLVQKLLDLEELVGEESLLVTDANLDSYHLIMLVTEQMPTALEGIAQLRGYGVGILAKKQISEQEKIDILVIKDRIETSIRVIEETTHDFQRYKSELHPILTVTRENIVNASNLITQHVIAEILQQKFNINPEYFFSTVTLALNAAYSEIYDSFIPATEELIEARIKTAKTTLALSVGIPGFLFLLIIYFAIGAHLAVSRCIASLAKTAQAFAGGDFRQRMQLTVRDEIGQIAESFNEMADGFSVLLEARRDDEIRIRSIIDTALDAVVQMDADGRVQGWNRQAEQVFGWPAAEAVGSLLHELIVPARYREAHLQGLRYFLDTGHGQVLNRRIEVLALRRDGSEFPIELAITPNKLGNSIEFSAFIRDISAQKRAMQTLQSSEQRHRALFESSRDALMTLSAERGFISGNSAALSLFACRDEQEFLAQTPATLSPERQADGRLSADVAKEKLELAIAEGSTTFEWVHRRLNGETFHAEVQLSRVEIENETVLQATVRDVSENKRAKAALVTSEARTRAVLRTMSDAVVLIDNKGIMLLVNDAIGDLFGYEEDELLGQNVKMLMPEPYHSEHDGYLSRHLDNSKERVIIGRRIEVVGKRKDGVLVPIELGVNELMDDFGSTYIGVMRDISQRKAIEQAREAARLEAEHLAHMKSEFLANMSHEIRTPLNAIIGLAKISVRDNFGRSMQENGTRIYDAGMHLLSLVNDILDFSKIEAGKMTLDEHPFRLDALIDDAISLVDMRAKEKQLDLVVYRPQELPVWVYGDPLRLRQILVNLLSNAVKFTEQGYVSLDVLRQGDMTEISVTDSGIGMTAEQVSRLFTAFEQADSSTTRKFGGSGLGLAISRDLANLMGGNIVVKSSLGAGSKFTLNLPLPATDAGVEHSTDYQQEGGRLRGFRILAAEDVALNRLVLEDLLVHEGAQVTFAENGQQALERLEEAGYAGFDAVLMDIQMPVMDGYQAAKRIIEIAPDLPIIGLTAHAMPEERQRCLEMGMRERVTKPIDANALVAALRRHVSIDTPPESSDLQHQTSADQGSVTADNAIAATELDVDGLIDWPAMLQRFDGRQAFIDKLIRNALDGAQQANLDKLRQAASQRDYETIKFVAHNLKGFAGIFEVKQMLTIAQQAEAAAKARREDAVSLAEDLADNLHALLAELQRKRTVET